MRISTASIKKSNTCPFRFPGEAKTDKQMPDATSRVTSRDRRFTLLCSVTDQQASYSLAGVVPYQKTVAPNVQTVPAVEPLHQLADHKHIYSQRTSHVAPSSEPNVVSVECCRYVPNTGVAKESYCYGLVRL